MWTHGMFTWMPGGFGFQVLCGARLTVCWCLPINDLPWAPNLSIRISYLKKKIASCAGLMSRRGNFYCFLCFRKNFFMQRAVKAWDGFPKWSHHPYCVQERTGHGTWCHDLIDKVVISHRLDMMTLEVFSFLILSHILFFIFSFSSKQNLFTFQTHRSWMVVKTILH